MHAVWTHQDPKHSSNLKYTQMTLVSPRGTQKKKKDRRDTNVAKRITARHSTNRKKGEESGVKAIRMHQIHT